MLKVGVPMGKSKSVVAIFLQYFVYCTVKFAQYSTVLYIICKKLATVATVKFAQFYLPRT
jgi:hypothetical protein